VSKFLRRREVVKTLLKDRDGMMVVGSLGAAAWDITDAGDEPTSFPMWGAMGGASMLGLGLALAQPKRKALVISGDGEMLMSLGSLATIAVQSPPNLSIVVLDNEHYGETGMQGTHTGRGVDLAAVAQGCGFKRVLRVNAPDDVAALRRMIYQEEGLLFALVKVDPEKLPLVLPPRDGSYIKNRFRMAVLGPEAALHDE
jgi:thiamine pyrophosphate-dependent acetolactate synthase large subunit-like protein